jgi:hypothetical protein
MFSHSKLKGGLHTGSLLSHYVFKFEAILSHLQMPLLALSNRIAKLAKLSQRL